MHSGIGEVYFPGLFRYGLLPAAALTQWLVSRANRGGATS